MSHYEIRMPGDTRASYVALVDGELVAQDRCEHPGRRSAVFRGQLDGRDVFVFLDWDHAINGRFVDVALGRSLEDLERSLRERAAAQPGHPRTEFDAADAQAFELARAALAGEAQASR
ncbi:MAG: hypothetical protein AB7N76_09580 [Planctomycetota bacterium]